MRNSIVKNMGHVADEWCALQGGTEFGQEQTQGIEMNAQNFIEAVKLVVRDGTAEDVLSTAENPPGRGVTNEAKSRAQWLKSLSHHDREQIRKLVEEGVDSAIFGLLCVIDGVRAVEDSDDKGSFELHYIKHGLSTPLNRENSIFLHDLFN